MNRKARTIFFYTKLKETHTRPKVFLNTLHKVIPGKNNLSETEKLVIHRTNSLNEYFTTIASSLLFCRQASGKYLGVHIDRNLSWNMCVHVIS